MKLSANHLARYKQIAALLWKYGRSDLVSQMGTMDESLAEEAKKAPTPGEEALPDQLADDLEAMGPTYVKLGQVLSGRPDLLPQVYITALARLQDRVKPFPYAEVQQIVEEDLQVRISKAYSRFDEAPIAAASLGQVHSAALRDGREVVVKVQRPGIAKQIADDFEVLKEIAEFFDAHTEVGRKHRFSEMLEEFRLTIQQELDYQLEAKNLAAVRKNLESFELIQIPLPVPDFCSRRVLTMEYVSGTKITKMAPVARLEVNGAELAEELFRAYLQQVLVDGLFHADPHPGNVFLTDDGRIALLDLGMVGTTTPSMQEHLLKVLIAIGEGNAEHAAEVVIAMSEKDEEFEPVSFRKRITQVMTGKQRKGLKDINVGCTLLEVTGAAADMGLYVPSELTLLGKTLLQLDEVGTILDPEFDPNAAIRRNAAEIMSRRMHRDATQGNAMSTLLELKDFFAGLPGRANKIMDAVANKEIEVKVKALDAPLVMEGLQKIANRVTSGLILAALIVGASLLMRIETSFVLFGYPGIAIICFLGAAGGGIFLLVSIFVQDEESARKARLKH